MKKIMNIKLKIANDVTLNFVVDSINGNTIPSKEEYAKRILETR